MIDRQFLRLALTALLSAAGLVLLTGPARATDTYWLATGDTTSAGEPVGYAVMNMAADFHNALDGATIQSSAIRNIALNYCTLSTDTTLTRPVLSMPTIIVSFPVALADSLLNTPLDGESPRQAAVKAVAAYLVQSGRFEALTVRKTGTGGTSAVATYP